MPKKRKKECEDRKWHPPRHARKDGRKGKSKVVDEEDPAILRKRKEIEEALALQRARRAEAAPAVDDAASTNASAAMAAAGATEEPRRRIPGHFYDAASNRYFKLDRSKMSACTRVPKPKRDSRVPIGDDCVRNSNSGGLTSTLRNRMYGHRSGVAEIMKQLVSRCSVQPVAVSTVSPSDVMGFHPNFGLAISAGSRACKFVSDVLPPMVHLQSPLSSQVLALSWNPSTMIPILASIKHTDIFDRIEVYRIDPENVHTVYTPQVMEGVLPARSQKEIFQSIEWALDGQACFSGGDVGLWKHDIEGRRGRHLILDGITTVNTIEPLPNGCVTVGLRNGSVIQVDERDRDRKGHSIATLLRSIDHLHTLSDGCSLVCQDITNNILLYDTRAPGRAVHTVRGLAAPATPRGYSYYEGEASVRSRKFWVSPRLEYVVVSSGVRSSESLVVLDPKVPLVTAAGREGSERTNIVYTINSTNVHPPECNAVGNEYWKMAVNGAQFRHSLLLDSEFSGCCGMKIANPRAGSNEHRTATPLATCFRVIDYEK